MPVEIFDNCMIVSPLNQYFTPAENLKKAKTIFHIIALTAIFVWNYKRSGEKLSTDFVNARKVT